MPATTAPRTMVARYRGTCLTCSGTIIPGDEITYAGRGLTYHVGPCTDERDPDAAPTSTPSRGRRRGTYYGSGPRARGRCEDAPCCGCCGTY
jgi:hypothetical protein